MLTSRSWKARPDVFFETTTNNENIHVEVPFCSCEFWGFEMSWHNETMLNLFLKMNIEHSISISISFGSGGFCLGLSINILYCTPFTRIDRAFLRKWWCFFFAHRQGRVLLALRRDEEELCWLCWIQGEIEPMKDSVYYFCVYVLYIISYIFIYSIWFNIIIM